MATTEETDVECVENNNFQYDELTKTDHWLQQLQVTMNSKLADVSTVTPNHRPKASDAVLDENNKTECVSSPQNRITYVLYRSQSSIEYSGSETVGNITTRIMSQNEILTSVTSIGKQDEILDNITSAISQHGILKNITASNISHDELLKNITTATISQHEIFKHITTSSIPEDEMLPGPMSTDRVSEHSLIEHFCYEEPNCLLTSFSEQLSITCQMPTDEVSIDGVHEDTHEENPTQMYTLCYNENGATTVNELQPNNNPELVERGLLEQNSPPGRGIPVTPYTRRPTVDQAAQPAGLTCLRSTQGQRISRSAQPVPRILQPSLGMRIPVELRSIPNRHNEFILQVNSAATCSKPLSHDSDTPNFCSSSGGATRHMGSRSGGATRHMDIPSGGATRHMDIPSGGATRHMDIPSGGATRHMDSLSGGATRHVDIPSGGATRHMDIPSGGATRNMDIPSGGATRHMESPSGGATRNLDIPSGGTTRHMDSPSGGATRHMDILSGGETRHMNIPSGGATRHMDIPSGGATRHMDIPSGGATRHMGIPSGRATRHMESPSDGATRNMGIPSGRATRHMESPSGGATRHMDSSLEGSSVAPTTPSSSSSVISGTERQFTTTEEYPPSKDGWMHHKNGHIQAMHNDTRTHSQTNVHAGIKTGSNLSKPHLVQSQQNQQNRPMMNSDVQQYNYFDYHPFVNEHHMLDPTLYRQQWNYGWPPTHLPDLRALCSANDTDPTTSRRQTPSIAYETVCPQNHPPHQVGDVCNTPHSFYNCVKDNSYLTPRGSQFHQPNQHSYSNHSIPCVNRSQVHAYASTGKYLSSMGPSQSRQTQPVYAGNHSLAQHQHIIHGQRQRPVDPEIASKQNSFSGHKKCELPVQQSHKGNHDSVVHASTEATTEGRVAGTTQACRWSTSTSKPQSKHVNTRMDKVTKWLRDKQNVSIGENLRLYEHINHSTYNQQDTQQTNQHDELTARHTHVLVEHSGLPRGLFDGQPLPDSQQAKASFNKKHSPHNACLKETVKKGGIKHPCSKEVQKNKTQTVDRHCIYESSLQFQHCNNTDICNIYRPALPTNGLCSDMMIDRIRQKQLPKYKSSVALHCRCCEANVPRADEAIDQEIKLREEKSLKEPAPGLPTSLSDREHVDTELLYILPDRTNSPKATSNSNRNKGEMSPTTDADKHSHKQRDGDTECLTRPDTESWLTQMSRAENDAAPVRQEERHIQTCNTNMHGVQNITSARCSTQISNTYCDDTAVKCETDNAFNCESSFLYSYLNHDKQNAELDRIPAYTQEANNPRELDGVSYDAPKDKNTESIKPQYGITENQTALSTLQTHKVPPDYVKKYADNTSAEHDTDRQLVDVNHRPPEPLTGSRNIHSTQPQIHSYENARFLPPDLTNNCWTYSATSCHTTNVHSDNVMSQCIPHSFQNTQRPSLLYATQTCESQSVSKSQSKTNQLCYTAPPSHQASFVMTTPPCFVGAAASSSQAIHESPFKTPYSVEQHPHGGAHRHHPSDAHRHYYEAIQTAPCYPSIGADSDVSMSSDNSLSRAQIINVSAIEKMHSYQQNLVCKDTLPTCYQLQYQELQMSSQNLQKQKHNLQLHLENQHHKDTQQQEQLHPCLHQRDKQVMSQDRHDFHRHGSKGGMHLPCFLQSADCDDDITPGSSTNPPMISPHLLNQMSCYQSAECTQSETLESIMTSISEKSQMSTSTSNDCYVDTSQASRPHFPDTAHTGSSNTAQLNLNQMSETSSKTAPSLQQSSASSSNVTNRDTNIHSSTGSQFPEEALGVFPQLNFEDCRDAIPLSPASSPDMASIQTVTKPDQVLVTDDASDGDSH